VYDPPKLAITVKRQTLLTKLTENKRNHAKIVEEAKAGYLKAARAALQVRLQELEDGKLRSLSFSLRVPEDHTADYTTMIGMLEMSEDDTLILSSEDFHRFIEDEWDWMGHFLAANAAYSRTAVDYGNTKGLDL